MKKPLSIAIAALFLATGTAHAYPARYYDCGKAFVKIQTGKGSASHARVFPTSWIISENWEKTQNREKGAAPLVAINLRCTQAAVGEWNDKCWLNGKVCHKMSDEEGKKEFPDED
jgi:hypothetical protein